MVGTEFLDALTKYNVANYVGVEDFADKFNFLFTVIMFLLCTTIVTMKQYLFKPIACYMSVVPSGNDFDDYVENFCWVHGTIPLYPDEATPNSKLQWEELDRTRKINYYQWVPFVLGLQCILFYLPRVIWQLICYNRSGTDLEHIVTTATKAGHCDEDRKALVQHIADTLEDMFFQNRDFRTGRIAAVRRKAFSFCSFCVISKRFGTWLVFCYFFCKILYFANCIGQLYLMQNFLGFNGSLIDFGYQLSDHIFKGLDWETTLIFPRVAFCYVDNVHHVGSLSHYLAQCALPANMLNEKVYIFLWCWVLLSAFITLISIPSWLFRMGTVKNRSKFVKKFLRITNEFDATPEDKRLLKRYIREFLRHDGVFLLRMLSINAGDLVTSEIVRALWTIYKKKYKDKNFLKDTGGVVKHLDEMKTGNGLWHRGNRKQKEAETDREAYV